ncbi:hypothetical protein ACOME3_009779 [Neoechinorhynchus agilis]
MSRHYKNIDRLLCTGLTSKDEICIRQELLSLYDSLQNELKSYPSAEYTIVVEYLHQKMPSLYSSNSVINHKRAIYATICIICCGGILFNDLKASLRDHLWKLLFESTIDELSGLIASAISHFEATQSPAHALRFDNVIHMIVSKVLNDQTDVRRLICLNTLAEVAARCPNHVFPNIRECLPAVLKLVFNQKLKIRYAASLALRSVIFVINYRETLTDRTSSSSMFELYQPIFEKISKDYLLSSLRISKHLLRDENAHGKLLLIQELYRSSVISQQNEIVEDGTISPKNGHNYPRCSAMMEYIKTVQSYADNVHTCTFVGLHALRLRRISGSLLSQPVSPVTMLEPLPELVFKAPFAPKDYLINIRADIWTAVCLILKTHLKSAFRSASPCPLINTALELLPWLAALYARNDPLIVGNTFGSVLELLLFGLRKEKYICRCLCTFACLVSVLPNEMEPYVTPILVTIREEILTTDVIHHGRTKNMSNPSSTHHIYASESVQANVCFVFNIIAFTFKDKYSNEIRKHYELLVKSGLSVALSECTHAIITYIPELRKHCLTVLYNYLSILMQKIAYIPESQLTSTPPETGGFSGSMKLSSASDLSSNTSSISQIQTIAQHFYTFGTLYVSPVGTTTTSINVNAILMSLRTIEKFTFRG